MNDPNRDIGNTSVWVLEDTSEIPARELRLGLDIGSTTVKVVAIDARDGHLLYSRYIRHMARQARTAAKLLEEAADALGLRDEDIPIVVCGSGAKPVAEYLHVPYVQEVVADANAVAAMFPDVRCAIELGGQDAKVIFFSKDEATGATHVDDMRMNGSCAGGTGAFIDEIAKLLDTPPEEFEKLAAAGTHLYDISGRCGVFAKTDIQPLLIAGARREDIALSSFHAIAKQVIGGLSQGLELRAPILFEGGPLTFNPTLIKVFAERLNLGKDDVILPPHPETFVARGAALSYDLLPGHDVECGAGAEGAEGDSAQKLRSLRSTPSAPSAPKEICVPNPNENNRQATGSPGRITLSNAIRKLVEYEDRNHKAAAQDSLAKPFFATDADRDEFFVRHEAELMGVEEPELPVDSKPMEIFIGVDSGSTTSKFVFLDRRGRLIDSYYASNHGKPLEVIRAGLLQKHEEWLSRGISLRVLGFGTTGYGEQMCERAFGADVHTVETVSHAKAAIRYVPDVSFVLDIGGQDMKAIRVHDGIVTDIMLNEACSAGCGSFLENFADTLGIRAQDIADAAFSSRHPAALGSRCTVFMTSTVVNAQRDGRSKEDILAGLCRSIIENVFTKVVRVGNFDELGDKIVVQGGTFRNMAVLRAIEEYLGRQVRIAPYPGEMGALGVALIAKDAYEKACKTDEDSLKSKFIGFEALRDFRVEHKSGIRCKGCQNSCALTVSRFPNGRTWVSGNRCERGMSLGAAKPADTSLDLFAHREEMLKADTHPPYVLSAKSRDTHKKLRIGIPMVLEFWDSLPFWKAFFESLGHEVIISNESSHALYEGGLQYVSSDTVCLPAKLVHGHIRNLAKRGVDAIFFPHMMHVPPEGVDKISPYMCSIVMGYPTVARNSQDPAATYGIPYETPVFHWFSERDRQKQVTDWARGFLLASKKEAQSAFQVADAALHKFRTDLQDAAREILNGMPDDGSFAVVLAGRPYHSDPYLSHDISKRFAQEGIPVLPVDSLPGIRDADVSATRVEITNNFHTRMLAGALIAAQHPRLEYVQIVSFGCGHDAVLTDEITRILEEAGSKHPLILKVDESEASGSIGIRVRSFIETVRMRREKMAKEVDVSIANGPRELKDAYPYKFRALDKKRKTVLIPNISEEVSIMFEALMKKEGFRVETVPVGTVEQIKCGKRYTHNDICFPCQMVIGELIDALRAGNYSQDEVAVGMVKFQCDCRMSHYAALLRRALDNAGFPRVPVLTTDAGDTKDMHPGVALLGPRTILSAVWGFMMLDILAELKRKIRPYEVVKGSTDAVYMECVHGIANAMEGGLRSGIAEFRHAIDRMGQIEYDRSLVKPRVLVTGELLVTYHPGSNFNIEEYLEGCGTETLFPRITSQLRKDFLAGASQVTDFHAHAPLDPIVVGKVFDAAQATMERIARKHPLYSDEPSPNEMYDEVRDMIPKTLSCGEGWLMSAEIAHYAKEGVRSFVILQPFGCIPNHVCGRGMTKRLKATYPGISILPLDLDPDTSFANIENRLQMLVMQNR